MTALRRLRQKIQKEKIRSDQKRGKGKVGATRKGGNKFQHGNLEGEEISAETSSVKKS